MLELLFIKTFAPVNLTEGMISPKVVRQSKNISLLVFFMRQAILAWYKIQRCAGRIGNAVLLYPLNDPWAVFFEGAEELSQAELGPMSFAATVRHQLPYGKSAVHVIRPKIFKKANEAGFKNSSTVKGDYSVRSVLVIVSRALTRHFVFVRDFKI